MQDALTSVIIVCVIKLPCNIGTVPGSGASYFTILLFVLETFATLLSSLMHFVNVNPELQSMVSKSVPQSNYSELWRWTLWTCAPSTHPKTSFTYLWVVVCTYKFIFKLTVSFCNLISTAGARCRKLTNFQVDVTRLSPPLVLKREPRNEAWRNCGWGYACVTKNPTNAIYSTLNRLCHGHIGWIFFLSITVEDCLNQPESSECRNVILVDWKIDMTHF